MDAVNTLTGEVLTGGFASSPELHELGAALAAAQLEIRDAKKSSVNPHFKSKYADLSEIVGVVRPVLAKHGIAVIQGASAAGNAVTVTTRLLHKSGQWIEMPLTMVAKDAGPQAIGSCITYARRYGVAAICGIASDEDDDGNAAVQVAPAARPVAVPPPTSKPDGYDAWWATLPGRADEGTEALAEAWRKAPEGCRAYVTQHEPGTWAQLKKRADTVKVPA
jgi:hypothetical protein